MLFFLAKKWILPKQSGSLRELSFTFFWMSTLCSFLCILAIFSIQFLQFVILSSFIQRDFHLSFSSTERNLQMWKKEKTIWEKELRSPILREFSYATQAGILFRSERKLPIEIESVPNSYFSSFPIVFLSGKFDSSLAGIVISEEIAFQLKARLGDVLEFSFLKSQFGENVPISLKLLVTGILKSMPGDNPYIAFAPLTYFGDWFRESLKTGVLLKNIQDAPRWKQIAYDKARILMNEVLSRHYNLLFSFQWEKILLYFVLFTILFISCIIIYISFSIVFRAYRPQWALLKTLGMGRGILLKVFFIKTLFLVSVGFLTGFFFALSLFLTYFSLIRIPWEYFFSNIMEWKSLFLAFMTQILLCHISFALPIYRYYNQSLLEELKNHD